MRTDLFFIRQHPMIDHWSMQSTAWGALLFHINYELVETKANHLR